MIANNEFKVYSTFDYIDDYIIENFNKSTYLDKN